MKTKHLFKFLNEKKKKKTHFLKTLPLWIASTTLPSDFLFA